MTIEIVDLPIKMTMWFINMVMVMYIVMTLIRVISYGHRNIVMVRVALW